MGDFTGKKSKRNQTSTMNQMNQMIQGQVDESKAYRDQSQAAANKTRKQYEDFQFSNPFEGMENRFEDMTVDMRAAEFQAQQGQQQRANIMQGLRGAAGSSGIAGLAQSLANQGQLQTQQIAAGIGQQERQNQMLSAQEGSRIDQMERQGQASVQAAEAGKQSTLLGMDYGALAGANQAYQGSLANQMSGMGMKADMYGAQAQNNMFSTLVDAGAQLGSAYLGTESGSEALTDLFNQ
tara:strand:- start:506 stop:1216 length:711 start_codon:yes stop_codon:yes gene_type:complete